MNEPNLSDLEVFVAVARARSFRGAASQRNASPSALSAALKRLEAQLGVRLLHRNTRSVSLTEAGERLLGKLLPAFKDIAEAVDVISAVTDAPRGILRLNVPTIVAREILPPIANRFLAAHPGVTLEVAADDSFVDVLGKGFDAGIRYDERIERDMIAVPIGPRTQHFVLAASPAYLLRCGTPEDPRELTRHACLRHRFLSGSMLSWEFERGGEVVRINPEGPLIASTTELEVSAAIAGLGVIYTFEEFLRPAIERGALVPLLADWWQHFSGPFLYYASRQHMPSPLRAFVDFIKSP